MENKTNVIETNEKTSQGCGEMFQMGSLWTVCGAFWLCPECAKKANDEIKRGAF